MAAFAIAFDAFDLALDPHDACTLCNLAQIRGIKRGVEMKGMGDAVEARVRDLRQPREAVRARRRFVQRIVAEPPRNAFAPAPQPTLRKLEHTEDDPELPHGVQKHCSDPAPSAELDTQPERTPPRPT